MKNKRWIIGVVLMILLVGISYLFDAQIVQTIEGTRNFSLNYFFIGITFLSNILITFFILTSLFLWQENKRRWILPLWLSGLFAIIISFSMKYLIGRPRPYELGIVSVLGPAISSIQGLLSSINSSFPSFHAMLVFSVLPILIKEFKKIRYIWLIFACLVAFSRVYFGVHYMSDILTGALIGYIIGSLMITLENKKAYGKKIVKRIGIIKY